MPPKRNDVEKLASKVRNDSDMKIFIATNQELYPKAKINRILRNAFGRDGEEMNATYTYKFAHPSEYDADNIVKELVNELESNHYYNYELRIVDSKSNDLTTHIVGIVDTFFVNTLLSDIEVKQIIVLR